MQNSHKVDPSTRFFPTPTLTIDIFPPKPSGGTFVGRIDNSFVRIKRKQQPKKKDMEINWRHKKLVDTFFSRCFSFTRPKFGCHFLGAFDLSLDFFFLIFPEFFLIIFSNFWKFRIFELIFYFLFKNSSCSLEKNGVLLNGPCDTENSTLCGPSTIHPRGCILYEPHAFSPLLNWATRYSCLTCR